MGRETMKKEKKTSQCKNGEHHYQLVSPPSESNGNHILIFCEKCGRIVYKYVNN